MEVAPHLALWPGVCLTVVVYSLSMFGDAGRDLTAPTQGTDTYYSSRAVLRIESKLGSRSL